MMPGTATLEQYRNLHCSDTIVVCGCGSSLSGFTPPEGCITIGVNDVGRQFDPDYLVVLNPRNQFSGDRFQHVERSRAKALFTQLELGIRHPHIVRFRLGRRGGADWTEGDALHYTRNSPYVALQLALYMGARRIGMIGVDFADHHFFGRTGRHPLTGSLEAINAEYARVYELCQRRGIEVANLSAESRLTAFPKADPWIWQKQPSPLSARIFFVHYQFQSCGDVFRTGLENAARELGVESENADWNDCALPARVGRFAPDLLFVVHGRRFAHAWKRRFDRWRTAVWLLDEPYEVDDTERTSRLFDFVFVNDPSTIERHRNAHYLPVAFDPELHKPGDLPRDYDTGFVGGSNASRERFLQTFADAGLLSYVVGGPWSSPALKRLSLSANIPPSRTAGLYQRTRIVLNVFRDKHHFNHANVPPYSLNPRVYEAFACGALVLSEHRPEADVVFPDMPVFRSPAEALETAQQLLASPERLQALAESCRARLATHTYAARLTTILEVTKAGEAQEAEAHRIASAGGISSASVALSRLGSDRRQRGPQLVKSKHRRNDLPWRSMDVIPEPIEADPVRGDKFDQWDVCGPIDWRIEENGLHLRKEWDPSPGSERGLVYRQPLSRVSLSFELWAHPQSCFLAKIHQASPTDQRTNSYHFYSDDRVSYLARHDHVFATLPFARGTWTPVRLSCADGVLSVATGAEEALHFHDSLLTSGFVFVGVKAGEVRVRDLAVSDEFPAGASAPPGFDVLHRGTRGGRPAVSIITTVYDRSECLCQCIRSVKRLKFQDLRHIIVSDAPPAGVLEAISKVVAEEDDGRIHLLNLHRRSNNWGITPAAVGLRYSSGEFVTFLSDDNGYTPDHITNLIQAFRREPRIGIAYSSCAYAGRSVLRPRVPRPGGIDLGQPMFRRELFSMYLNDDLPFNEFAWDWALINTLLKRGVAWRHVDKPTFIFRLAQYPELVAR